LPPDGNAFFRVAPFDLKFGRCGFQGFVNQPFFDKYDIAVDAGAGVFEYFQCLGFMEGDTDIPKNFQGRIVNLIKVFLAQQMHSFIHGSIPYHYCDTLFK
jgi:hypothetical protein